MKNSTFHISRRQATRSIGIAGIGSLAVSPLFAHQLLAGQTEEAVRFFFVTDTHYLAQKKDPKRMDEESATKCRRLVETMNSLEFQEIPKHAGGGMVGNIQGVLHGGDLVDSADKRGGVYGRMIETEIAAFERDYGLTGKDGLLKFPVYEVYGNHDGPQGDTHVIERIKIRNKKRVGIKRLSPNGVHYSWDWGGVHFINLGIVVGESGGNLQRRRYAPLDSLQFLRQDLKQLEDNKQPIVITQHIDIARYSSPYEKDEEKFLHMEWHPQDVQSFFKTIQNYNVIADFYGHTHARNVYGWNGTSKRQPFQKSDVDVFNGDNASHFHSDKQAFFYVEILNGGMLVRELKTDDAWKTSHWSKQIWGKRI